LRFIHKIGWSEFKIVPHTTPNDNDLTIWDFFLYAMFGQTFTLNTDFPRTGT